MKKIFIFIIVMLLSGCGASNATHKTLSLDDETIWNQYHVNMEVFSERSIEELTDNNQFFKMKPSISINSRSDFHGAFFYFEITENSKPYEFINQPKLPINQFSLEIDELKFKVIVNSTTSSPDNNYLWIYITGIHGKLNYFILLAPSDKNDIILNQYNESDEFKLEDKERIIELIRSIFTEPS